MKTLSITILSLALWTSQSASAASLMINFRSTSTNTAAAGNVGLPYLTLSPAHARGSIPSSETTWNNFNSAASTTTLSLSDGSAATGLTLTFGSEATSGSRIINFTTTANINLGALYGSGGGTNGNQPLTGNLESIYGNGNNNTNTAAARAGWLGAGSATGNSAIGLRVDGLAAGEYLIYVMATNTNSNFVAAPTGLFATAGDTSSTFDFNQLTGTIQTNPRYTNADTTVYNNFIDGENYVAMNVTLAAGESLFLASAGASTADTRGFLNSVQIVPIPEPSVAVLSGLGLLALAHRRH